MNTEKTAFQGNLNLLDFNLNEIWGPTTQNLQEIGSNLINIPYAPFGKQLQKEEFTTVDTKVLKQKVYTKKVYGNAKKETASGLQEEVINTTAKDKKNKKQKLNRKRYEKKFQINFKNQVRILPHFELLSEMDKNHCDTAKIKKVEVHELFRTGQLKEYNKQFDYVNWRKTQQLNNLIDYTSQDHVICQKDYLLWDLWYSQFDQQRKQQELYEEDQQKKALRKQQRQEAKKQQQEAGQEVEESSESEEEVEKNSDEEEEEEKQEEKTKQLEEPKVGSVKPPKNESLVIATETVLLAIMTLQYSVYPFELKCSKEGNVINLCVYDQNNVSWLGQQIINENWTSHKILDQDIISQLCLEATQISNTFQEQAVSNGESIEFGQEYNKEEYPERIQELLEDQEEGEPVTENKVGENNEYKNKGFRYVKINIDDKIHVTTRCQIDAWMPYKRTFLEEENEEDEKDRELVLVKTLNEYDLTTTQWRNKLQNQLGDLISTIQMNNLCLLNKWLLQMYLTGATTLKIAYVSRNVKNPEDPKHHTILNTETYTYNELKKELKVNPEDTKTWKLLKHLVTYLSGQEDGDYLLLKHPYSQSIKFYHIPKGDFQYADEYDEDEELQAENQF